MITLQLTVDVKDDRQIVLTLPPDIPTGPMEFTVTIAAPKPQKPKVPGTSLAEWAEKNAIDLGEGVSSEDVSSFTGRRY